MPPSASPAAGSRPGGFLTKPRKLPNSSSTFRLRRYGSVNLYLTDTYLLELEVVSLREIYLKFAYKDIQAMQVRLTQRGAVYNWILGLFTLGLAAFSVVERDTHEAMFILGVFAGLFLLLLLVNLFRGPTCHTMIQTATGRQHLRSLARFKKTSRALAMILERVEPLQGALDQANGARAMEDYLNRRAREQRLRTEPAAVPAPATIETAPAATPE